MMGAVGFVICGCSPNGGRLRLRVLSVDGAPELFKPRSSSENWLYGVALVSVYIDSGLSDSSVPSEFISESYVSG